LNVQFGAVENWVQSGSSFFEVLKIPPGLMAVHHFPLVS